MKNRKKLVFAVVLIMLPLLASGFGSPSLGGIYAFASEPMKSEAPEKSQTPGQIYLYGEHHGVKKILDKELELWHEYYHNENMRHLFVESPYYTAEFLNIWMKSDSDDILEDIYKDWAGSAAHSPHVKAFYAKIKSGYPETIFHGTDIGHQYASTGQRFLKYLETHNMESSEQYLLAQRAIEQGKYFYTYSDDAYRENKMTENFIRELDKLHGENIMGIYGGAHTGLDEMDFVTGSVPCMANQLRELYGDAVHSENLAWLSKDIDPYRTDVITINEKDYEALYFGKADLTGFRDYAYREFWRLENAYDDFKNNPKTGDVLPYDNYPMLLEAEQVFIIDYTKTDGSVTRTYYRSDGNEWNRRPTTEEFTVK